MTDRLESKIKPALTPEEWRHQPSDEAFGWAADELNAGEGPSRHGLAAYALHGQPFGFTWEDVDALRNAEVLTLAALSIADRIAALLPPRP